MAPPQRRGTRRTTVIILSGFLSVLVVLVTLTLVGLAHQRRRRNSYAAAETTAFSPRNSVIDFKETFSIGVKSLIAAVSSNAEVEVQTPTRKTQFAGRHRIASPDLEWDSQVSLSDSDFKGRRPNLRVSRAVKRHQVSPGKANDAEYQYASSTPIACQIFDDDAWPPFLQSAPRTPTSFKGPT